MSPGPALVRTGFLGLDREGGLSAEERTLRAIDLSGRTVFDVGAFDGAHTLFFAERVGTGGRVFALDPHPDNRARISAVLSRVGVSNVSVRGYAAAARRGRIELVYPEDLGRGSADPRIKSRLLAEPGARRLTAEARDLDTEIARGRLPEPDLIKLDVEGYEGEVLEGLSATARRRRPALFVELHGADSAQEAANYRRVLGWLSEHDYSVTHVESGRLLRDPREVKGLYAGQHLHCT